MSKKKASPKKVSPPKEIIPCVPGNPVMCPKCGCTDRTRKEAVVSRDINGHTREGFRYSQVKWSYVSCVECSLRYRLIEYLRPSARTCET